MATLRAANAARRRHSAALTELGAHGIAVEAVTTKSGRKQFVVVAFFSAKPHDVPEKLDVTIDGKRVRVPLKVKIARPFAIEPRG